MVCSAQRYATGSTRGEGARPWLGLSLTFWPNPVYRNHPAEKRWYFSVAVREMVAQPVQMMQYQGEWYDMDGRLLDTKAERLDMRLAPSQHSPIPIYGLRVRSPTSGIA